MTTKFWNTFAVCVCVWGGSVNDNYRQTMKQEGLMLVYFKHLNFHNKTVQTVY